MKMGEVPALELGLLRRLGGLEPGTKLELEADGVTIETLAVTVALLQVTADGVVQRIEVVPNRWGGYLRCPDCSALRTKLYMVKRLACRACHGLVRGTSHDDVLTARRQYLRRLLRCEEEPLERIAKPPKMAQARFDDLFEQLRRTECVAEAEVRRWMQRRSIPPWMIKALAPSTRRGVVTVALRMDASIRWDRVMLALADLIAAEARANG
ncbi:hypothetical protein J2X84_002272 [Pseudomonas corrugata]|jgi:hypothetical protein|uniref:hypothetical protein n=1 Tax=Pseudomonas corrugata TaxID=47879 RepID=UPI0028659748|nr:hypothetical protein [Pseudomonas corrugata]MDR7283448.1 hypothetical protein [Pseudomonas corrugata]